MEELQLFEKLHGKPLTIGMKVKIDPAVQWACEWEGEYLVTGINWSGRYEKINVTINSDWTDGGTDGWSPDELLPVI